MNAKKKESKELSQLLGEHRAFACVSIEFHLILSKYSAYYNSINEVEITIW